MREHVDRRKTLQRLPNLDAKDLHWLIRKARRELKTRWEEQAQLRDRVGGAMTGMANVMAGVTWALACRQSLRRSKEHSPDVGKRPASGEMWLPHELLYALRHEVKERQWSPLGAKTAQDVLSWLNTEATRHTGPRPTGAVAFRVRMAGPTYGIACFDDVA